MPTIEREKSAVHAFRAFLEIAKLWDLSLEDQFSLLGTKRATFFKWKKAEHPAIPEEKVERLSYLLGIYKALQILLPTEAADRWIKQPNQAPLFKGRSALDYMREGRVANLYEVRRYLDAYRGGWA